MKFYLISMRFNSNYKPNTAPHQSRKKRELTRAVETLKIIYGGERVPHRLLSAPLALSANVFA